MPIIDTTGDEMVRLKKRSLATISVFTCAFLITSCATTTVMEAKDVNAQFQKALSHSAQLSRKLESDYQNKSAIYEHISSADPDKPAVQKLTPLIEKMATSKQKIVSLRETMSRLNADFSALAYNKKYLKSSDPKWVSIKSTIDSFQQSAAEFNEQSQRYSQLANQFAEITNENKLFYQVNSAEVLQTMHDTLDRAKKRHDEIQADLQKRKSIADQLIESEYIAQDPERQKMIDSFETLKQHEKTLFNSLVELRDLRQAMERQISGRELVKSSDADWKLFSEKKGKYDRLTKNIEKAQKAYQLEANKFSLHVQSLR